jgi:antitoxin component of MazEF toxin-antitoxin module
MTIHTVTIEQDGDDLLLPIPDEIISELGLDIGDELDFKDNKDGTFSLTKIEKDVTEQYYLVECISQYRMRYVVRAKTAEHAKDTVTMNEAKEFSQLHLGETIIGAHEITHEHIIKLCDEDNDYVKTWNNEKKFEVFVTEDIYEKDKTQKY